ncbi:MAG TPA: hypothetical protein PK281_01930 [Flavobacteriales bacterium]|nr:hypothetical protein [Flavobacteriales bacterium]
MDLTKTKQRSKKYLYITLGISVSLLWISLFLIGLLVNSDYYRVAINYNFWDWEDVLGTFVSFTLSNVALLAFLSGLLGGITSILINTQGFRINREELLKNGIHHSLIENPAISAIRGIIIFIGLLSIQYATSFTDLSAPKSEAQPAKNQLASISPGEVHELIIKIPKDSINKDEVAKFEKQLAAQLTNHSKDSNDIFIQEVQQLKFKHSQANSDVDRFKLENDIEITRRKIHPPADTDFGGITLQSYFKFAIIASLLAFIMGYDPSQFNSFLNRLPGNSSTAAKTGNPTNKTV